MEQWKLDIFEHNDKEAILIDTLQLDHPSFDAPYFICRDKEKAEYRLTDGTIQEFIPINFNVKLPSFNPKLETKLDFQIDIINFDLVNKLNDLVDAGVDDKLEVIYTVYVKDRPDQIVMGPMFFEGNNYTIKNNKLVFATAIHSFINVKFPLRIYSDEIFPGILYVEKNS